MKEKFAPLKIDGIETDYIISNFGRVFNKERELKTQVNHDGYSTINLHINGSNKPIRVHRAVFESFNNLIPEGMYINHIDGNKLNNCIRNLEVVTPRENTLHAWKHGLCKPQDRKGEKNPNYRGGEYNPHVLHTANEAIAVYNLLKSTKMPHRTIAAMLNVDVRFVDNISKGLWADVTGYNKEEMRRNHKFTEEEEIIIWYLSNNGYKTKDIVELTGVSKDCLNNKLTYLRRNKARKMNNKLTKPENIEIVKKFLSDAQMFSVEFV